MPDRSRLGNRNLSNYQSLEERRLLAGNVTVFENVNLYIRGDQADNQFEVVVNDDQLEIVGLEGTTINNKESYVVDGANVTDSGVTFEGGLRAHLGPGHDELELRDVQFEEFSLVYGGTGDDSIDVIDSRFLERTMIQTFDGDDAISTSGSQFEGEFRIITLDGEDSVSVMDSMMNGNAIVVTGNDSDSIHSADSHFIGEVSLLLSLDGDDMVQVDNPVVGESQLGIFLGNGDDEIRGELSEAEIGGNVRIGGQDGVDRFKMNMDEETESNVLMGTFEATGEVVLGNLDLDPSAVGGRDAYSFTRDGVETPRGTGNADLFTFEEDTDVYSIAFAGSYEGGVANAFDDFVIEIYSNEAGVEDVAIDIAGNTESRVTRRPDELLHRVDFTVDDETRIATGETYGGFNQVREVYFFTADVDLQFEGGVKYWITFYQKTPEQTPENRDEFVKWFYWHVGPSETIGLGSSEIFRGEWTADLSSSDPDQGYFNSLQYEMRS